MNSNDFTKQLNKINAAIAEQYNTKRKVLRELDLFVLDNSIRETTVGALRGHTLENKIKIYQETKKCGFEYVLVASFNHMTRVGDTFCQWLVDNNEDRSKMFSFSEVTERIKNGKQAPKKFPFRYKNAKKNLLKNDHQHHTVPYSNPLHHVNNPRPVSTLLGLIRRV